MQDAACSSSGALGGWEWPLLDGVEVWGWQSGAENVLLEVLVHDKSCSSYQVVQRSKLDTAQVSGCYHGAMRLGGLQGPCESPED